MNIPEVLKIGWRKYTIQEDKEKRDSAGDCLNGEIDYSGHVIYLNNEYSNEQMKVTLIHEILHGIFYKQGHSEWCHNENLVNGLAEGLYELIIDNPNLFK